jgi:2-dehydropantoate 2-reductase
VEPQRVLGGIAGFYAGKSGPGVVELLEPGRLSLGEPAGAVSPRLRELGELIEPAAAGFLRLSENITGELWSALRLSACLGSLGALTGSRLTEGAILEEIWDEGLPLWEEIEDLARLEGLQLEEAVLNPDPTFLMRAARPYAASMLDDLERGERSEVDFLNGFVQERAKMHGAQTPLNNVLRSLIKEMEKGMRDPGPANLAELRRRIKEERTMGLM